QVFAAPNRLYQFTTPFDVPGIAPTNVTPTFVASVISGVAGGTLTTPAGTFSITAPNDVRVSPRAGTYQLQAGGQSSSTAIVQPKLVATGADAGGLPNLH